MGDIYEAGRAGQFPALTKAVELINHKKLLYTGEGCLRSGEEDIEGSADNLRYEVNQIVYRYLCETTPALAKAVEEAYEVTYE